MTDFVEFNGLGVRFLLDGESTGGALAVVEHPIAPRVLAAPTHTHQREDEYSYVLEGRVGFQVGDEVREAGPGEAVAKPRGTPHAFWNPGDEPARLLEIISPAGFEQYFRELAPLLAGAGPPDVAAIGALQARYALTMDFSTIDSLSAAHGLRGPE
jgi:quercetin dioxygenase-like cupin family protein